MSHRTLNMSSERNKIDQRFKSVIFETIFDCCFEFIFNIYFKVFYVISKNFFFKIKPNYHSIFYYPNFSEMSLSPRHLFLCRSEKMMVWDDCGHRRDSTNK